MLDPAFRLSNICIYFGSISLFASILTNWACFQPTCVFGGGHNTEVGRHPSRNRRRSIDTMSILFPTDIDIRAARRQERAKLNTELEAQAQNSLSEFFRVKLHEYYSPSSCSRSDLDAVSNYEEGWHFRFCVRVLKPKQFVIYSSIFSWYILHNKSL